MDASILGALISAAASVLVALIGRERGPSHGGGARPVRPAVAPRSMRAWKTMFALSLAWMTVAVLTLHWDTAALSCVLIPVAGLVLAFLRPIKPSLAAATMLLLCALAFGAEPLGKLRSGIAIKNHLEAEALALQLAFALGTATIVALVSWWRVPKRAVAGAAAARDPSAGPLAAEGTLATDLARLASLHQSGVLSAEEFALAKKKLLSG